MNDIENARIARQIDKLKILSERSNGEIKYPSWLLDKSRDAGTPLTLKEQQEWAECISQQMRRIIALEYLTRCDERWGRCDGETVFRIDNVIIGLNRELIENIFTLHIEKPIMQSNPYEGWIAVFRFYYDNDQPSKKSNVMAFLDDVFKETAKALEHDTTGSSEGMRYDH